MREAVTEIMEGFERLCKIQDTFAGMGIESQKAVLCALIDMVAEKEGKRGYEMIEELLPILKEVNDAMGAYPF